MTDFVHILNRLSEDDARWLSRHEIQSLPDLILHMEKIANIFTEVSQGMLSAFQPVVQSYMDFLSDMPSDIKKQFEEKSLKVSDEKN